MIKYVIEKTNNEYTLYSIVDTDFGGPARNYVCSGPKEFCELQKFRLESTNNLK